MPTSKLRDKKIPKVTSYNCLLRKCRFVCQEYSKLVEHFELIHYCYECELSFTNLEAHFIDKHAM